VTADLRAPRIRRAFTGPCGYATRPDRECEGPVRPYPAGWWCSAHSPSATAGLPEVADLCPPNPVPAPIRSAAA